MTSSSPSDRPADPVPDPSADAWTTSLDEPVGPDATVHGPAVIRRGPALFALAALMVLVTAALAAVTVMVSRSPAPPRPAPPPAPAAVGSHLAVPIRMQVPDRGVVTADTSYIGVQVPGSGVILVTVPTEVSGPGGDRSPLPDDPAEWLGRNPQVLVSRVRQVQVGGVAATQVDYRRSQDAMPASEFARLSLFCSRASSAGSRRDADLVQPCTRITPAARVRATFLPVGGKTVLVEAIWRNTGPASRQMPPDLKRSYQAMLSGVRP